MNRKQPNDRTLSWLSSGYFRFSLRRLLFACLAVGGVCGCWFQPKTVDSYWYNGTVQSRLTVRRAWNGDWVSHGQQTWFWPNGQVAVQGESYGDSHLLERSSRCSQAFSPGSLCQIVPNPKSFDQFGNEADLDEVSSEWSWRVRRRRLSDETRRWEVNLLDPETPHSTTPPRGLAKADERDLSRP